ncbi:mechanosensitive ion channel family protein [Nocardiopsis gilva]|uniref:mechanosensitive ion channel family protein n=1 Tax=Nocardiopsis gilva TaxID=280236 RepID=UPI00034D995A|nr:mechanosensitive ion channel domain-containing protein [Nocardiopsis gilva]
MDAAQWTVIGVSVAISVLLVTVVHWLLTHQLSKVWQVAPLLVRRCRYSAYAAAIVVGVNIARPDKTEMKDTALYPVIQHVLAIAMIITLTWLAITIAYAITDSVLERLSNSNGDADRRARRLQTQVRLLRRIVATVIAVIATAAVLFTFDSVKLLGAGLLTSAGLIGIVAGVAAQSTLGNLFAGLQLAFSDSLRINDIVVFEGNWGRIEELSLTNVTVRLWDERRLVVPVSHFTGNAFENWTKESTSITGWVMLRVDWSIPIERLRAEVGDFVTSHPLWDGRRWSLQATDILEGGLVELRAVATTADSDARWDLCCDLREHLISFITTHYPDSLPRRRTEFVFREGEEAYAEIFPDSAFRRARARSHGTGGAPDGSLREESSEGPEGSRPDGSDDGDGDGT